MKQTKSKHKTAKPAIERHQDQIKTVLFYNPNALQQIEQIRNKQKEELVAHFKSDEQMLKEQYQFIRSDDDGQDELSRKYYDKLFKEFALVDLSQYKKRKIGMRWRVEKEVFQGRDSLRVVKYHVK